MANSPTTRNTEQSSGPNGVDSHRRLGLLRRSFIAHALLLPYAFCSPFIYILVGAALKRTVVPQVFNAQAADLTAGLVAGGSVMVLIALCAYFHEAHRAADAKGLPGGLVEQPGNGQDGNDGADAERMVHAAVGLGSHQPQIFVAMVNNSATSWIYIFLAITVAGVGYEAATEGLSSVQLAVALAAMITAEAIWYAIYSLQRRRYLGESGPASDS